MERIAMSVPSLSSLALKLDPDETPPDWADVVIETIPPAVVDASDPARWAREIFSAASVPGVVTALMAMRELFALAVGASRGSWDVFRVQEVIGDAARGGEEARIGYPDRHLDFRAAVGVDVEARLLWVTTAVWFHGRRGRTYFLPVRFLHDPVTRAMMRRAIDRRARGTMAG
jgi:Protein of unknown function (DUF2867)